MKSFVDKFLPVILIVVMLGAIAALGYVFLQYIILDGPPLSLLLFAPCFSAVATYIASIIGAVVLIVIEVLTFANAMPSQSSSVS